MEPCLNQNVQKVDKASDKIASTNQPETCNLNLVSLSGPPEPRLLQRSEAPAVTDTSSSQPPANPLPDAPMPSVMPSDGGEVKPEDKDGSAQAHTKSTKPSIYPEHGLMPGS